MSKLSESLLHFCSQDPPKAGGKSGESAAIAAQIQQFIASGGKIEQVGTIINTEKPKLKRNAHLAGLKRKKWNTTLELRKDPGHDDSR